ncbi:nuclease-related domain-containing protein [Cupriavidus basilensis]|uniref:nuclease-related domain-containing protein n=1 Tax=Cupriavidus basilensis TaxID=68895 RepID=UPI0020A638FA|nr:nuclease-related domain-containing protein [Cupriavidus basilensis]MCP3025173.1 NERD domain-containing protein [Cupriavidus basilensis]
MKEDILEQMVDEYLQHKGYFTRHNLKFRPDKEHGDYKSSDDSVHSDIDVIGIHPLKDGPDKVWVVSCKSWQGGFRPEWWCEAIKQNKKVSGREAWRGFRELVKPKWAEAFRAEVLAVTGATAFTYVTAVTRLHGDRISWESNATFLENLAGNPIQILTFTEMLKDLYRTINTTPATSEVGRVLQLIKASGWTIGD